MKTYAGKSGYVVSRILEGSSSQYVFAIVTEDEGERIFLNGLKVLGDEIMSHASKTIEENEVQNLEAVKAGFTEYLNDIPADSLSEEFKINALLTFQLFIDERKAR